MNRERQATLESIGRSSDEAGDETNSDEKDDRNHTDEKKPLETPTADEKDDTIESVEESGRGEPAEPVEETDGEDDEETEVYSPSSPGGPFDCPACGRGASDCCYRCSVCYTDLASNTNTAGREGA